VQMTHAVSFLGNVMNANQHQLLTSLIIAELLISLVPFRNTTVTLSIRKYITLS